VQNLNKIFNSERHGRLIPPAGRIRSGSSVEIFLNLAWAVLAVTLVALWLRTGSPTGHSRRSQIISIAVLIAILFPVISVSDDLMAAQNPAETDNCQRRDHLASGGAHALLAAVTEPPPILTGVAFSFLQYVSPGQPAPRVVDLPALTSISNRPPPAA
jgi:hypothetical protein